uniref:Uncharacterized protein n=1 Tax=Rhizophora mucronata TaxID=61149 RepID=A0A2P2QAA4_RHIMU
MYMTSLAMRSSHALKKQVYSY